MKGEQRKIQRLVGEELSAVSFVRDYVEFHFDGPVLRALSHPVLSVGDQQKRFPERGARDALCGLIGCVVAEVDVRDEVAIRLGFESGEQLIIPLDRESRAGPEAAHYQGTLVDAPLDVW